MRVSVVVPTYRRPEALVLCLDALARQAMPADEILVVARRDDSISRQAIQGRQGPIRLIPIDVPAGRPGFVAALNAGIDASSGEVVCLTDDDAEPRSDWISRVVATFAEDASIGAVGGRDWVYHGGRLEDGAESVVGTISWWGRAIGRHHLGVGPVRDVEVLKGVNLSARGDLIRAVGFDARLFGVATEHHSELGLCLRLRRMGHRVVYDPAIAVDHRPRPRAAEAREFGPRQVRDATHNETLALLEHLSPPGRVAHILWSTAIGTGNAPGLAQALRSLVRCGDPKLSLLWANFDGRRRAIGTFLRGRAGRRSGVDATGRAGRTSTQVLAVAHSAAARTRAEQLLDETPSSLVVKPPRGIRGMALSVWTVLTSRARVLYLVDVGRTTAPAALLGRLLGRRVIVDTGDACLALSRSLGDHSFAGLLVVGIAEQLTLRSADEIVVRGRAHVARVPGHATQIPDLAPPGAGPTSASALRTGLGVEDRFVVGLVGSLILSPRLGISYGWDLIEALHRTDREVVALIVGEGSGREALSRRARELGVEDRCHFVGEVPADRICEHVCAMDVALSTQTNDVVGQVRTTGKLPLYLACHRPVLASHVGEAARLLGPHGWTIPYRGRLDRAYPERLAAMIENWRLDRRGAEDRRELAAQISRSEFAPEVMRERLAHVIEGAASGQILR